MQTFQFLFPFRVCWYMDGNCLLWSLKSQRYQLFFNKDTVYIVIIGRDCSRTHPVSGLSPKTCLIIPNEGGALRSLKHAARHYRLGQWNGRWAEHDGWLVEWVSACGIVKSFHCHWRGLWRRLINEGASVRNALLCPAAALISPQPQRESIDESKSFKNNLGQWQPGRARWRWLKRLAALRTQAWSL